MKLNKNLSSWDHNGMLLDNLQRVLELTFPSPQTTQKSDFMVECGICYSYRIGERQQMLPDKTCDNPKCARPFHRNCLYEWLKGLTTSRQSFDTIFGTCPYCSNPISISRL